MSSYFRKENELYSKLEISGGRLLRKPKPPTSGISEKQQSRTKTYLPTQPCISLDGAELAEYLRSEFVTPDLDRFAPHLWLVATQDSSHISSLTQQLVRGRSPVITENPELHLVWMNNTVYIKPLPKYLLSHAFWEHYFPGSPDARSPIPQDIRDTIYRGALGFLRSYFYLIRHRSDFRMATQEQYSLIPKGIRYADFMHFISCFEQVSDDEVSPRYSFGDLRLTRLNLWAKVFLRRFTFHKIHQQYADQFRKYYGPLLFIFGYFSVALSAMQVVLAGLEAPDAKDRTTAWAGPFGKMSRGVSVLTLVAMLVSLVFLMFVFLARLARETVFALKDLWFKKRTRSAT